MFIPLTKVDAETRTVYGLATGETADRSGEICDYATTKPFYEAWSGDIAKASAGKSFGNVRAMHGSVAAGVVKAITFNDASKQIEIAAKIVDDAEWKKVQEGVYTGFSQGGGYVKRWKDEATGLQRYTANPSEVSLVDLPCLPTATFQLIKAAGAIEARPFAKSVQVEVTPPSNADVNTKAKELAKAAGRETAVAEFFAPAREALMKASLPTPPEAKPGCEVVDPAPTNVVDGVEQVWKAKDGSTHAKKADALAKNAELDAAPGTKAVLDALGELGGKLGIAKGDQGGDAPGNGTKKPGEGKDQTEGGGAGTMNSNSFIPKRKKKRIAPDGSTMKAATVESLAKDLYTASRFAELLASLRGMAQSAEYQAILSDNGNPDYAAKMKAWVGEGCSLLVALVQSEVDDLGEADEAMAMSAGASLSMSVLEKIAADVPRLGRLIPVLKAGARNSKADQDKIQAMHDHAMDLGATCDKGNCGDDTSKAAGSDLSKALAEMTTGRNLEKARGDALQKTLDQDILPMLKAIGAKVDNIERQPMPLPLQSSGTRVVAKGADPADDGDLAERLAKMKADDPDAYTLLMIRAAQQNPQQASYAR